ncbi:MAG TPA: cupredoxin domain-containing protein [Sandaracinaceae bacterium]
MRDLVAFLAFAALLSFGCGSQREEPPSDGRPVYRVQVNARGYEPSEITAPAGQPVRLVFTRTTDEGCGQQLVFPELDIRRDLPLDEPVAVDLTMPASGRVRFTCGMDMYEGALVAR